MLIKNRTDLHEHQKNELLGSLLHFTQIFYLLRTGRKFNLSNPNERESHFITICKDLTRVIMGEIPRLMINVPPRYGKTELLIHFVAWALAKFGDSNFIYVSYAHLLAKKQTQTIRNIIEMQEYRDFFNIYLKDDTSAKDNFEVNTGGSVYAVGAGGSITGRGAGIQGVPRFGGAIIIDDIIKPADATSDTIRDSINDWYYNTLQSRLNSPTTPIIFIGQRVHEDDLAGHLAGSDEWHKTIIPALDEKNNPLHPDMHDLKSLLKMKTESPYVFAAQYQQNPQPSGGGIFKPEWFKLLEDEPEFLLTFITTDTAETDKNYNDATVFNFLGLYKILHNGADSGFFGLHCIDCEELRVEPKDLKAAFLQFYANACRHKVKPKIAAIEKKSTGTTLLSVLEEYQGLELFDIERTRASGNKTARFLEAQPYVAARQVSLPAHGRHTNMVLTHMSKITANNTHRFDDIADTFYDGIKLALIDKVISSLCDNTVQLPRPKIPQNARGKFR